MEMSIDKIKQGLKEYHNGFTGCAGNFQEVVDGALDIIRKYQKIEDFARWVAEEVIDEELWTYNYLAFAELACRKLVQLRIMQESDGEYTYTIWAI